MMATRTPIRRRKTQRGAAMVEAAVVIPTLLVFLGVTIFSYRSYDRKLTIQTRTRSSVLHYASHACEGSPPASISQQGGQVDLPDAQAGEVDRAASRLRASERAGVSRALNMARSQASERVQASASQNGEKVLLERTVRASSAVACNEKRYDNQWTALIEFAIDFARSGGGVVPGL
jgi:hypothetical protein